MKNIKVVIFFVLMCLLKLGAAGYLIYRHQTVVEFGMPYKFKCIFYDPVHPFQGRYLALNYPTAELKSQEKITGNTIYCIIDTDSAGYAYFKSVHLSAPPVENYITLQQPDFGFNDTGKKEIYLQPPFTKFYIDENMAPKAEKLVSQALNDSAEVWAEVQIRNGNYVLKDVKINDISVKKLVEK